ncbi:hypothetical protein EJ08DRAFT_698553 [Tothia fuscella]|uniref:Uncharacterized protein n=1 Tax=Tothia fuscella TaxID=1048955 RepID=A0A9P4NPB2_9PEZI|nr:hypothetical protein EJ08DRAFT_698553 [Tothia fuscella]
MDRSQQSRVPNQPYSYSDSHFAPGPAYNPNPNAEMGKQHFETIEMQMPPLEHQKTSGSFRSHNVPQPDEMPTEAEMSLLRKLRTLNGADYEAQYFDNKPDPNTNSQFKKMGNPTALALAVFAFTNTLMSLFLMRVRGVKELNFLVGTMWFIAGTTNVLCAVFELLIGNTFAWTIFGSLGAYFLSMGALLTPGFGVAAAYAKHPLEFKNAMGLFNCCWAAMFLLFLIVSLRTNIFMVMIFFFVSATCTLEAVSSFKAADKNMELSETLTKVAGVFLFLSSIPNWYLLFLILAASAGWHLKLPHGDLGAAKAHAKAQAQAQQHTVGKKVHTKFYLNRNGESV